MQLPVNSSLNKSFSHYMVVTVPNFPRIKTSSIWNCKIEWKYVMYCGLERPVGISLSCLFFIYGKGWILRLCRLP